jgi:hypothetical protein
MVGRESGARRFTGEASDYVDISGMNILALIVCGGIFLWFCYTVYDTIFGE